MKRQSRFLAVFLLVLGSLAMFATSCAPKQEKAGSGTQAAAVAAAPVRSFKVAFLIVGGTLGDQALNDACWAGIKKFTNEVAGAESTAVELKQMEDIARNVSELQKKGFELIIFNSAQATEFVREVAADFPEIRFVVYEGTIDGFQNVTNLRTRIQEAAFAAGAMNTLLNEHLSGKKVSAMVAGVRNPDLERTRFAFEAATNYLGGQTTVVYLGNFNDASKAKEITQQMHSSGVRIVQAWAGGANTGVYEAAASSGQGFYSMGAATGQFHLSESIIVSLVKNSDTVLYDVCKQYYEGKLPVGIIGIGMAENACGLKYPTDSRSSSVPQVIKDQVAAISRDIISGKIIPPSTKVEFDAFMATIKK